MNNFVMKLSGRKSAALGGFADCALTVPVLAFDPCIRDRIAATVHDGSGLVPTCTRVGKVH